MRCEIVVTELPLLWPGVINHIPLYANVGQTASRYNAIRTAAQARKWNSQIGYPQERAFMGSVVVFTEPRTVGFESSEDTPLQPREVRLRTLYSGISAGTELTAYRGSNPYLHKQWDASRKLFIPAEQPTLTYPVSGWGYEEVGEVIELGSEVRDILIGDIIFGAWGHRTHHIVEEEYARGRVQAKSWVNSPGNPALA